MTTDYSQVLRVHEDGCIWWQLEDAIKLGAGYLPVRDNKRNLLVLRAPNDRVLANERTLLVSFHKGVQNVAHPWRQERDGDCFVHARKFIERLSQYIALTQSTIPFPSDLARAVKEAEKEAEGAQAENAPAQVNFDSLEAALKGWFDKYLAELPDAKRLRIAQDLRPMLWVWDKRTEGERRSDAKGWDYLHDPELEPERQRIFDLQAELYDVNRQIREWELMEPSTISEKAKKEDRITELRGKVIEIEAAMSAPGDDHAPKQTPENAALANETQTVTRRQIEARLKDISGWRSIWDEEKNNGLIEARIEGKPRKPNYDIAKVAQWATKRHEYAQFSEAVVIELLGGTKSEKAVELEKPREPLPNIVHRIR